MLSKAEDSVFKKVTNMLNSVAQLAQVRSQANWVNFGSSSNHLYLEKNFLAYTSKTNKTIFITFLKIFEDKQ